MESNCAMAFYESPKLENGRVAKPHLNLPDQKTMDIIAYKIKLRKRMLLEREKELEIEKNFDFKKEVAKRFEQHRQLKAVDEATRKKRKMYAQELCEAVKLSFAALREGKVIGDRSVLNEDIDFDSDSVGDLKICVRGSGTPCYTDDAYGSVADKIMKTDFFKADNLSADDPAEFEKEPQHTVEKGKKTM